MDDKKNNINENGMDIFTKGFVKPMSLEDAIDKIELKDIEKELDEEKKNIIIESEFIKNSKTNDQITKEKVDNLIMELSIQDEQREKKQNKNKKTKNIILIVGIIIELLIISFLAYIKFFKEDYSYQISCINETENESLDYAITAKNIYYFDKNDTVVKTENNIIYIFNNKKSYDKYKSEYVSTDIEKFLGISQKSIFDDKNYVFQNKTIYNYNQLKKNKKVKVEDNLLTISIPSRKDTITLYISNYDSVVNENNQTGFVCE